MFLLRCQITGDQALKVRNLVVWAQKFKVVGPWELSGSPQASGLRTVSQGHWCCLLWKYMKLKMPHVAMVCWATKHLVWPGEQGGKAAHCQQRGQFVRKLQMHRALAEALPDLLAFSLFFLLPCPAEASAIATVVWNKEKGHTNSPSPTQSAHPASATSLTGLGTASSCWRCRNLQRNPETRPTPERCSQACD